MSFLKFDMRHWGPPSRAPIGGGGLRLEWKREKDGWNRGFGQRCMGGINIGDFEDKGIEASLFILYKTVRSAESTSFSEGTF